MARSTHSTPVVPDLTEAADFIDIICALSTFFVQAIDSPCGEWDDLLRDIYGPRLRPLVRHLVDEVHHPATVNALLALKWHFATLEDGDDKPLYRSRGLACELVAWRFVSHLTTKEAIDALCYDLPPVEASKPRSYSNDSPDLEERGRDIDQPPELIEDENTPLIATPGSAGMRDSLFIEDYAKVVSSQAYDIEAMFAGLNALEIAVVADGKRFIAQKSIQNIIDGLWYGDIVFWTTFDQDAVKKARVYRREHADPFCRLRVPFYHKMFEVLFFAAFLAVYYTVLIRKASEQISGPEVILYIWLASFAYDEIILFWDAGSALYAMDFWSLWDVGIIVTGATFFITRMAGLVQDDLATTETAFDILSVEALLLVPRICSMLTLHPYIGMLVPALKEMTKDFTKFLGLVAILYIGFTTTFAFLARGTYSFATMNWMLIKIFFGSTYIGFDIADKISPILGPPLMLIFICLTNVLLVTSLISLLSNTLTNIMQHAQDEYLFLYAVYVLETSSSNRLTYFLPPMNLLPLILLRPLRLFMSTQTLRQARVVLLKITHWPLVAMLLTYERGRLILKARRSKPKHHNVSPLLSLDSTISVRRQLSTRRSGNVTRAPLMINKQHRREAASTPLDGNRGTGFGDDVTIAELKGQLEVLTKLVEKLQ